MKAVILAGGIGSRMFPFTLVCNKHMTVVYDKPQILWVIEALKGFQLGIVIGWCGEQIQKLCTEMGIEATWIPQGDSIQDNTVGLAHAIYFTRRFVGDDPSVIVLGDQLAPEFDIQKEFGKFVESDEECHLVLKWNETGANNHTVIEVEDGKITSVEEKPPVMQGYTMTGFYFVRPSMYQLMTEVEPNAETGQVEFSDVVRIAVENGMKVGYTVLESPWFDCGTPDNILKAANYLASPWNWQTNEGGK